MWIGQIIILIVDIALFVFRKKTWFTEVMKSILYFCKGDIFCTFVKLMDVEREMVYEYHDRIVKYTKLAAPIIFTIIWFVTLFMMNDSWKQWIVAYGAAYVTLKSWFKNKKSYFEHITWFIYNILTGMYILAVDELIYIGKRCYTEIKEIYMEELEQQEE